VEVPLLVFVWEVDRDPEVVPDELWVSRADRVPDDDYELDLLEV